MKNSILIFLAMLLLGACSKNSSVSNNAAGGATGTGGSLARFTIVGNYLYTINGASISVFDISIPGNPVYKNKITIAFDIEAMYPYGNKLFIASNTAMYIYSLSNPESPAQEAHVQHLTGCDPVVTNGNYAFLTIHGGNRCGSSLNQLQIYDVSNIAYPQFINSITLTNPWGLGLMDNYLFVCDNGSGLRVFDVADPYNVKPLSIITGENFIDIIPMNKTLICMLTDGVAYYDATDINMIKKLATVKN